MAADLILEEGAPTMHLTVKQIQGVLLMQKAGNVLSDPRPDLAGDSGLWEKLLPWSYGADGAEPESLFGALKGFRACGARLEYAEGRVRLLRGELPASEYAELRTRYLLPHAERLNRLLSDLGHAVYEREQARQAWAGQNEKQEALL